MDAAAHESRRVRLRTRWLAELMRHQGWSAQRLSESAGEPSKRAINRWLQRGEDSAEGFVTTDWRYVVAVAEALGVAPGELVEMSPSDGLTETTRYLRLAAALGPRVYPDLMRELGLELSLEQLNAEGPYLEDLGEQGGIRIWRFVRWAYCEEILRQQVAVPRPLAADALSWATRIGLYPEVAPELHCLANLTLERPERAWDAGRIWMAEAMREGGLPEVAWVGERLRAATDAASEIPFELRADVTLRLTRSLRLLGRIGRALELLSTFELERGAGSRSVLRARLETELALARGASGQLRAGVETADRAMRILDEHDGPEAREALVEAAREKLHLCERVGEVAEADRTRDQLRGIVRRVHQEILPRYFRMTGGREVGHVQLDRALRSFRSALDLALAHGEAREASLARLNLAIVHALRGESDRARTHFEQAAAYADTEEGGARLVGSVHKNFGEFLLEQHELDAARRHLRIALAQYEAAGHYPLFRAGCYALLAEAAIEGGDPAEGRRWAARAHQEALLAEHPGARAMAYAVHARAHAENPASVDSSAVEASAAEAEAELARLREPGQLLERLAVERRCAQARYVATGSASAREALHALRERAVSLGLASESRRIEALLHTTPLRVARRSR